MSKLSCDALIIGGGVIGTAITYYLSKAGMKVILVEEKNLNAGASGACDEGVIIQSKNSGIMLEMAMKSTELYKNLSRELDYPIEYRNSGGMILINEEKYIPIIENFVKKQRNKGVNISMLDYEKTHKLQPGLSKKVIASTYSEGDSSIYPFKLTLGYIKASKKLGAKFLPHNKVIDLITEGGKISKVITNEHEISTKSVINAAGNNASKIGEILGIKIPVFPVKGHLIITEQLPPIVNHQIMDAKYIVAKHNPEVLAQNNLTSKFNVGLSLSQAPTGNLIIGGCRENVGYDTNTSYDVVSEILENALDFFPFLRKVSVIRTFAGLRPSTQDGLPILSSTPIDGFYVAAGLGGDGLSLSPIVGKIMCDLILNGSSSIVDVNKFSLNRFEL